MSDVFLKISNLSKEFKNDLLKKNQVVLDNLSVEFAKGECTGFLGHNGAGKTTTIRMILGLLKPDHGKITIDGELVTTQARRRIGYMAEVNKLPSNLTPIEILNNQLRLYAPPQYATKEARKARIHEKLQQVGLETHAKKRFRNMSKGMGRRIAWALATIHEPEFLILDEPSSGLDPLGRKQMLDWITIEKERGTSIMLCTHELNQINALCDHFFIINRGRLVLSSRQVSDADSILDWRHNYNLHLSGASEEALKKLGEDNSLLPWQGFNQEGYLSILGFAEYTDASAWMAAALKAGLVVVRFGDQVFLGEEEILPYFEGDEHT